MQQERIRQLENALAHLGEGQALLDQLVWLRARQVQRRAQRSPRLREQMQLLIADIDQVRECILEARAQLVAARGSRKD